jgi:hypothetical protein
VVVTSHPERDFEVRGPQLIEIFTYNFVVARLDDRLIPGPRKFETRALSLTVRIRVLPVLRRKSQILGIFSKLRTGTAIPCQRTAGRLPSPASLTTLMTDAVEKGMRTSPNSDSG